MEKGLPFRMRVTLCMAIAALFALVAAPAAFAQSPDDIPGFDQLPIPGGEDPAEEPTDDPDDGGSGGEGPQVDAPGGGVDTGAGGLAADDSDALALAAAGALAAMGGAALVARRRAVRS